MSKKWHIKPALTQEFLDTHQNFPPLVAQMLYNRNLIAPEAIDEFLHPEYGKLHSPFLFRDMEKAVERVWQAIDRNEQIFIYGDYDADAVTANAVLQQSFRYLGVSVESYIPDRFTEGYGLNLEAFEKISEKNAKLVITVDCGTNSVDAADFCRSHGIDLIITDHHEILGEKPSCLALINPKNPDDEYPYHEITGVGVAFKLACGILQNPKAKIQNPKWSAGWEKWLLDLVAIGTVADCHSLLGENRILVKFGLKVLTKTRWTGLKALCSAAQIDCSQKMPDTYTLGFMIAPRLNAAGRLTHANTALHLLMEDNPDAAITRAMELEKVNQKRQEFTQVMVSEAREQALLLQDRKILVLWKDDWQKGVVGLVAGKIAEEFRKPTIVLQKGEEESTGSARTVGEFNVVDALKHASDYLTRFGGHKQAAGLTVKTSEYDLFYQKLIEYADTHLTEEDMARHLDLEAELGETQLNLDTYSLVNQFEPFGVDNVHPKFLIKSMVVNNLRMVGGQQQHAQLQLQVGSVTVSAIAFNFKNIAQSLEIGDTVDVAAELTEDGWNGRKQLKLRVVDIKKI